MLKSRKLMALGKCEENVLETHCLQYIWAHTRKLISQNIITLGFKMGGGALNSRGHCCIDK